MTDSRRTAVLDQVLEVAVLLNQDMSRSLGALGLTPARTHLLWELLHRGPSTQRVLAEALGVSARNVTGLVDGLEQTSFVVRRPHPDDRRATLVTLTGHGTSVVEEMRRGHEELAQQLLGDLDEPQVSALGRGLDHVLARLRALVVHEEEA